MAAGTGDTARDRGDARGCDALHQEIVERIRRYDSTELLQLADSYFPNHRFFALSALGAMPKNDGAKKLTKDITPNRIADPLLWLLWQRGFIPALKS